MVKSVSWCCVHGSRLFSDLVTNDVDYITDTPGRHKNQRLCHVNMLKLFRRRHNDKTIIKLCAPVAAVHVEGEREIGWKMDLNSLIQRYLRTLKPN